MAKLSRSGKCGACGAEVSSGSRFCKVCGQDISRPADRRVPRGLLIVGASVAAVAIVATGAWLVVGGMSRTARAAGGTGLAAPQAPSNKTADEFVGDVQKGDFEDASKLLSPELETSAGVSPAAYSAMLGPDPSPGYVADYAANGSARVSRSTPEKPYMLLKLTGNQWRITEIGYVRVSKRTEVIKFEQQTQDDPGLLAGTKKVSSVGADGSQEITSETPVVNGKPGEPRDVGTRVIVAASPQVVMVGTGNLTGKVMSIGPVSSDPEYGPKQIGSLKGTVKVTDVTMTSSDQDTILVVGVDVTNTGKRAFKVVPVAGYRVVAVNNPYNSGPWASDNSVLYPSMKPGYGLQGLYSTGSVYTGAFQSLDQSGKDELVSWPGKPLKGYFTVTLTQSGNGDPVPPLPTRSDQFVLGLGLQKDGYDDSDSQWSATQTRTFLTPMSTFWAGDLPTP